MKTKSGVIVFFLLPIFIQAQFRVDRPPLSMDSLKQSLPSLQNEAEVDCLNELARSYCEKMTLPCIDSALKKLHYAYEKALAINYAKGLGDACIQLGMIYTWFLPDYKKCQKYYEEAIFWYKKIENDNGLGFGQRGLGTIFLNQGFTEKAWNAFEQSAVHFKRAGNDIMLADLMDWFGATYDAKGDYEKHFEYIKTALRKKERIHNSRGMVWSFYRLAFIYVRVEDYETALDYLRQSMQQTITGSTPWQIYRSMGRIFMYNGNYDSSEYYFKKMLGINPFDGATLAGLGQLFMRTKEYQKALNYLQTALVTFKKDNDLGGEIWTVADIGKSYAELRQHGKALTYARECLAMAEKSGKMPVMQYAYEIHWNVYEALQQKDSANFYFRKFMILKDSLDHARFKVQHLQRLALHKGEVKEEQQQARIDLLNKDNQLKQQQLEEATLFRKILAGSLAILILLGAIIFRNTALKRKNEKHRRELAENELQMQKLESEKTKAEFQQQATELEMQALRAQMNPHFIFNCLSSINRFILKNETDAASDYLTKFSRLIRMVLTNSKKAYISIEDELDMLRLYIDLEKLRFKNAFDYGIILKNEIEPGNIFIPPLLLQPFAENAIWHGLMHKEGHGQLNIALSVEQKVLTCIISDDGIGREKAVIFESKSVHKQKSMGLHITTKRLALLNREIDEQSFFSIEDITNERGEPAGTKVTLKIHYKSLSET